MTIEPKPWKRWCPQFHDTWVCGRSKSNHCRSCQRRVNREKQAERNQSIPPPEFIPALRPYRRRCGFSVREVAFEASLDLHRYLDLEDGSEPATYTERVAIYQAISVLIAREDEVREAENERRRRLVLAGLM